MVDKPEDAQDPEGTDAPEAGDSSPQASSNDIEELKKEIAGLRRINREETAKRLASEHGLDAPTTELLAGLDRDKQAEHAEAIAEARKASKTLVETQAAGSEGSGPKPEGEKAEGKDPNPDEKEPANKAELAAVTKSGPEGGEPPAAPKEPNDTSELIKGTKNWAELEQAQAQAKAARRG